MLIRLHIVHERDRQMYRQVKTIVEFNTVAVELGDNILRTL